MSEIISREEAATLKLKRYYTGKPCAYGHMRERLTANGDCLECKARRNKRKYVSTRKVGGPGKVGGRQMGEARRIAIASGQKRYFTGKPCWRGHICERYCSGGCVRCYAINVKEYSQNNPEWRKEQKRKYYEKNRELHIERAKQWNGRMSPEQAAQKRKTQNKYDAVKMAALRILREAAETDPKIAKLIGEINDAVR